MSRNLQSSRFSSLPFRAFTLQKFSYIFARSLRHEKQKKRQNNAQLHHHINRSRRSGRPESRPRDPPKKRRLRDRCHHAHQLRRSLLLIDRDHDIFHHTIQLSHRDAARHDRSQRLRNRRLHCQRSKDNRHDRVFSLFSHRTLHHPAELE